MNEHGRGSAADAAREIKRVWESLPPPPRFDRIAVCDTSLFDHIPKSSTNSPWLPDGYSMFGIPVVIDADVPQGAVELRKGDEVVERLVITRADEGGASSDARGLA